MATTSLTSRVTTRLPFQTLLSETASRSPDASPSAQEQVDTPAGPSAASLTLDQRLHASESIRMPVMTVSTLLLIAENSLRVMQPLAIGLAINGLLVRSYQGLIFLVSQHLVFMLISSFRQMLISKQLDQYIAAEVLHMTSSSPSDADSSRLTTHVAKLHNRLHLFEQALPEAVHIAVSLCGALLMLAWYDWTLVPLCLVLILPAMLLNTAGGRRSQLLGRELLQSEEREAQLLNGKDVRAIRQYFQRFGQARRQLANSEASSFCLMQLFVFGLLATTLVHYCLNTSAQAGDIFAVVMYVLWFLTALSGIPLMVGNFVQIRSGRC